MKRKKSRQENKLLLHLVFSLLTVQVLVVAMGSVNSLVDGGSPPGVSRPKWSV